MTKKEVLWKLQSLTPYEFYEKMLQWQKSIDSLVYDSNATTAWKTLDQEPFFENALKIASEDESFLIECFYIMSFEYRMSMDNLFWLVFWTRLFPILQHKKIISNNPISTSSEGVVHEMFKDILTWAQEKYSIF